MMLAQFKRSLLVAGTAAVFAAALGAQVETKTDVEKGKVVSTNQNRRWHHRVRLRQ